MPHTLRRAMSRGPLIALSITLLFVVLASPGWTALGKKEPSKEQGIWWKRFSKEVKQANLERHVRALSSFRPRLAGYPGASQAAEYIVQQLKDLGLRDVSSSKVPKGIDKDKLGPKLPYREAYLVTVPWVEGQPTLEVMEGGKSIATYPVYPLWPNLVRTSQLPEGGQTYHLVNGGTGKLASFSGKDMDGTAVLMEFKSGADWLNAPRLGAKAVVFVEPDTTSRGEAETKFLRIPINIPRFWIGRNDAYQLMARLDAQPDVQVRIKCRMSWEPRVAWNIVAEIPGKHKDLKKQTIYLSAYYDSMSIVPQLSPGAESTAGAASLLEVLRILRKYPPDRTVRVIFNGAHFLGLAGIRNYVANHLDDLIDGTPRDVKARFLGLIPYTKTVRDKEKINLFLAFDLSTHSKRTGLFYKGMFYDQREDMDINRKFSDFARTLRENAKLMADFEKTAGFSDAEAQFADAVNPIYGKPWRTFVLGKIALDNEPITLGGGRGAAFATTDDARDLVDTPFDTVDHVILRNLTKQTQFIAATMWDIVTDPKMPVDKEPSFARMTSSGGFAELSVSALAFDPTKSIVADKTIPGTMVVARMSDPTLMGTRGDLVEIVNDQGKVRFWGYPTINAYGWRKPSYLEAYHTDENTGDIDYAPDRGSMAGRTGTTDPTQFFITAGKKDFTTVIFECIPVALFDLVDPQSLTTLRYIKVYDGLMDAEPRHYGLTIPHPEPGRGHVEDVALVFAEKMTAEAGQAPPPPARIKVMMGLGGGSIRMLLLDAATISPENESGLGYEAAKPFAISHTPLKVTQDMWKLDDLRINKLKSFRIVNDIISNTDPKAPPGWHEKARRLLSQAEAAEKTKDYQFADAQARAAWGYEARAYPAVLSTMNDVVKGVLFYLALMLPFAFFVERLVFAFPNLRTQIVGFLGVFTTICVIFAFIHPAFEITKNPWIVPLAFIMVALSVLVIALVTMKFENQLKQLQMKVSGVHRADIGRMGVAAAAFSLGISNMRKRKARTIFTCITLVLLTFTVLSFTSVKTATKYNMRRAKGRPKYQGLLVRNAMWEPLEESAYRVLNDEFGRTRAVAPRAWFFTSKTDEQSFIKVSNSASDETYDARALTGLAPAETRVTHLDQALVAGRWFRPGDVNAAIIPRRMADAFRIKDEDVNKVDILIGGVPYQLIGIISGSEAKAHIDLDQEPLTPVDWIQMQRMARQGGGQQQQQGQKSGFQEYLHLSPDQVVFIPFDTAVNLGAEVESVAVSFVTPKEVTDVLEELMPRLGFNLYAGSGAEIKKWSAIGRTSISGMGDLVVPILIAALIVLNTMLGAVYERVKEIHIFSSIGLAPNHIATLFMAESFVYAILGAIFGYLIGQGTAKIITVAGLLSGLYLNYSSVSAVASTAVVIGVVLLSTVYPARKASEVATPAIERRWQVPDPVGDEWDIRLPFAVTGKQATACTHFMVEWFQAYEEYSVGDFVTQSVTSFDEDSTYGKMFVIDLMAWVAPFDLGVSQKVQLRTTPTDMQDVYEIWLHLERVSGDVSSWRRVNRRFLNTLRKQFLIWRTLRAEDRDRYLGVTAEAAG